MKDGFDMVIANPPYVRHESIKALKPQLSKEFGNFFCGTADIYTYFYKKGIDLLKFGGHLCFIAPNKFMRSGYGKNTRRLLAMEVTPKVIIDFCDLPIFDATTYPSIILIEKRPADNNAGILAATFTDTAHLECLQDTLSDIGFSIPVSALKEEGWNLERPEVLALMEKLRKAGTPLGEYVQGRFYYGIKTGFNEAFVIDEVTRERLIGEDPKSAEIIKPWLRGRDIKKWCAEWAGLYLITIASSANKKWPWSGSTKANPEAIFARTFPAIYGHLLQYKDALIKRDDQGEFWWELRSCAYYAEFERPKIVYPNITKTNIFCYEETKLYTNQKCFIIPTDDKYLLAVLNSSLIMHWFKTTLPLLLGEFYEPSSIFMKDLPVFPAIEKQKAPITERVEIILKNPLRPDVPKLESEIDELVFELYGLSEEERNIILGSSRKSKIL